MITLSSVLAGLYIIMLCFVLAGSSVLCHIWVEYDHTRSVLAGLYSITLCSVLAGLSVLCYIMILYDHTLFCASCFFI